MSVHTHSAPFLLEHFCHVEDFFSLRTFKLFFFFFRMCRCLEVSPLCFCCACAGINVGAFEYNCSMCVCAFWFGNTQHSIACKDGWRYTRRNERRGGIKQRSESMARQDGNRKMCIRSHCASNVITGSDSSMWHTALPICQSEIGRVTNGYHCYFPQPPPHTHSNVCIFFECWGRRVT